MEVDIKHIAELSRISLTDEELEKFTPQMKTVLESVTVLKDIDTSNVQPMKKRVSFDDLREDIPKKGLRQQEVIKNAPHSENGYVKVYGELFGSTEES